MKNVRGILVAFLYVLLASLIVVGPPTIADEIPGRKYLDVGNYKVAYRQWGDPNATPVLVIHGIPLNTNLWSKVGPMLAAKGYFVVAPGQLGLSYTQGPIEADHSLAGQANMMTEFVKRKFDKPFILYGHDLGGGIAQIMVTNSKLKDQIDVSKIVISNSAVLDMWPVPEANAAIAEARKDSAASFFTETAVKGMVKDFASAGLMTPDKTLTPELLVDLYGNYAVNPTTRAHFIEYLKAMSPKWTVDASPKMVMWNKPAMLLWAIHDRFQPPYISGVALARIMPHAHWDYIDGSHFFPLEQPEEVVAKFVAWDKS